MMHLSSESQKRKSLGVFVDKNLKWDEHFNALKGKTCGRLASLKELKDIIPQRNLYSVYYAIVESHLRYPNEIWAAFQNLKLIPSNDYRTGPDR